MYLLPFHFCHLTGDLSENLGVPYLTVMLNGVKQLNTSTLR